MLGEAISASGWAALVLVAATTSLPYLFRPTKLSRALHTFGASKQNYLARLRPHFYIGYAIVALAALHAAAAMGMPERAFARLNKTGIIVAAVGLFLVFFQAAWGLRLALPGTPARPRLRRLHFWAMTGILATALLHVALNSPWVAILAP